MYDRKTGALIRASVMMGAACAPALAAHLTEALAALCRADRTGVPDPG